MKNLILSLGIVFLLGFGVIVPTKEAHSLSAADCIELIEDNGSFSLRNRCRDTISLIYCLGRNCSPARQGRSLSLRSGGQSNITYLENGIVYTTFNACIYPDRAVIWNDGSIDCLGPDNSRSYSSGGGSTGQR